MRHLHHLPLLFLPVNLALAQILVFNETTGLPACAYECQQLWAAQFNCSGLTGSNVVGCFCVQVGWVQGGSGSSGSDSGSGWRGCDSVCGESGGVRARVGQWLGRVCGSGVSGSSGNGNVNKTEPGRPEEPGSPKVNGQNTTNDDPAAKNGADQAVRARAWFVALPLPCIYTLLTTPRWKKNYPFFILAFLVVTVPILLYAFAVPIRKWAKRQVIQNRPRRQSNMEELGSGVGPGGFVFAQPPGGSGVWTAGAPAARSSEGFMGGAAGGGSGGVAGSRHGSSTQALDGPSSSGVFATEVLPPPQQPQPRDNRVSTRQESWERRVRAQFSRGGGFRLMFWKKKTREAGEGG